MYNMNVELIYNTLTGETSEIRYRKEFLDVFDLLIFNLEQINQEIEHIFKCFKDNSEFVKCMKNKASRMLSTDPIVGFMLCFSFDEFHIIHRIIQEYLSEKTINMQLLKQLDKCE